MTKVKITLTSRPKQLPIGANLTLVKDLTNDFDNEAIAVKCGGDFCGYVSAVYKTRKPGTISGGRIYDRFEKEIEAVVVDDQIAEVTFP